MSSVSACLVLIETSGNQRYIFDTNRRRENVGASELVRRAGVEWACDAIQKQRERGRNVDELVVASGKVLLQVPTQECGCAIVADVTVRALREAPGLDVAGYVGDLYDPETADIAEESKRAHSEFVIARNARPGPEERYLRIPIVAQCESSGLPASRFISPSFEISDSKIENRSEVSAKKLLAGRDGMQHIAQVTGIDAGEVDQTIDFLDENAEWIGVVHADGNGLGQIFFEFEKLFKDEPVSCERNKRFIERMKLVSDAVDRATTWAFKAALREIPERAFNGRMIKPVLPLVLGGDDATVICEGSVALQFARTFLMKLEEYASYNHSDAVELKHATALKEACALTGHDRLTAAAGVAIVKPHFPFSGAYRLSEELVRSAKQVKRVVVDSADRRIACSALDFHVVNDSSATDLRSVRERLERAEGGVKSLMYARPYIVSQLNLPDGVKAHVRNWVEERRWSALQRRVTALETSNDRGYVIPTSQLNDLRASLFVDMATARARFDSLKERYSERVTQSLGATVADSHGEHPLFWSEDANRIRVCGLLDAIDARAFLGNAASVLVPAEANGGI